VHAPTKESVVMMFFPIPASAAQQFERYAELNKSYRIAISNVFDFVFILLDDPAINQDFPGRWSQQQIQRMPYRLGRTKKRNFLLEKRKRTTWLVFFFFLCSAILRSKTQECEQWLRHAFWIFALPTGAHE
jgi:hypothetical protein